MCMQISYTKLDVTSRDCSKVDRRKARLPSFPEIITVFRDVALTGQWSSPSGCSMEHIGILSAHASDEME